MILKCLKFGYIVFSGTLSRQHFHLVDTIRNKSLIFLLYYWNVRNWYLIYNLNTVLSLNKKRSCNAGMCLV